MANKEKSEKKMVAGHVWNCANELKILLTALLVLCFLATLFQFIPFRFSLSPSDFRRCLSRNRLPDTDSAAVTSPLPSPLPLLPSPLPLPLPPPSIQRDQTLPNGVVKRAFNGFGSAAYNFVLMSAYRGGDNTFAVLGLSSKPLHVFGKPAYRCEWVPCAASFPPVSVVGYKILPDWGYGRVYTVVVVNCTFPGPVGADGSGGKLLLHASTGGGGDAELDLTDVVEAVAEFPGAVNASLFCSTPPYDYLYCGSSLYGGLSPQRVREWLAYHARLFGPRSHFVFYDAGGVHDEVMEVLRPWMDLGYVTLHDIRDQERFDGYYHNQFLVVNDCLHRYRFATRWMFFFDVDEFLYVPPKNTLRSVLARLSGYTQFTIEQMPMSSQLCLQADAGQTFRKWGIEKLVYRDVQKGIRRDRKYAVQPRNVYATGVHMSQNLADGSKVTHKTERLIKYYHYHGTIAQRREPCQLLLNTSRHTTGKVPYELDTTMRSTATAVKAFELRTIGTGLRRTRQ